MVEKLIRNSQVSIYGNVCIEKAYCPSCKKMSFVIDNVIQCCGIPVETIPTTHKRECEPRFKRIILSKEEKDTMLEKQEYKCFYCERPFGSLVFRKHRPIRLKEEFDHIVPFIFNANNDLPNFVAACQVCNRHKSSKMFTSLDEAKIYLLHRFEEKGYYE